MGCLGAILEASWRPLGPFWAVGNPYRREFQNLLESKGKSLVLASSGSPGGPLGALLGRLGGFLICLEAILGHWRAYGYPPSGTVRYCPTVPSGAFVPSTMALPIVPVSAYSLPFFFLTFLFSHSSSSLSPHWTSSQLFTLHSISLPRTCFPSVAVLFSLW